MTRRGAIVAAAVLITAARAWAESNAPTYDIKDLIEVRNRVGPNVIENFHEVILPVLGPAEVDGLADVRWSFPLTIDEAEPFAFQRSNTTIEFSAASILFLKDMSTASAWLIENGYTVNSLHYYLVMLKYGLLGESPDKPLDALCIPEDARDDPEVAIASDTQAGMALLFISLHELGHVLYDHPAYASVDPAQARANEAEADRFAIDVHGRLGVTAASMFPTFSAMAMMAAYPSDFESPAEFEAYLAKRTHPLQSSRIEDIIAIMGDQIVREFVAAGFSEQDAALAADGFAEILRPDESMNMLAVSGKTALIYGLAPRRDGEWLGTPCGYTPDGQEFAGPYDGVLTDQGEAVPTSVFLRRVENVVQGAINVGIVTYNLHGEVVNDTLVFRGHNGNTDNGSLKGRMDLGSDGTLTGHWAYDDAAGEGGTLQVHRRDPP